MVHSCYPPAGGDGGETHPGEGAQSLHRVAGLCLPDKGGALPDYDHHERRRPQVTSDDLFRFQPDGLCFITVVGKYP